MADNSRVLQRDILDVVMKADTATLRRIHSACKSRQRSPEKMITARQAAEILGTCPTTVHRYARAGKLCAIRQSSRRIRFSKAEVEELACEGVGE